jgi:hypothetical protein
MEVRITRLRVAMAALFVLAGIGLASLLSPLVGTALATVGSTVNISDHSSSAYFAKVDSGGALKTTASVTGKVAPALPPQPFSIQWATDTGEDNAFGPTTATLALTDAQIANYFGNQARSLLLEEYSAPAPNTNCVGLHMRLLASFDVNSGDTVKADYVTPIVIKPLASGEAWCLHTFLTAPSGDLDYNVSTLYGGYVVSGTFTPPSGPSPAKLGRMMHRR